MGKIRHRNYDPEYLGTLSDYATVKYDTNGNQLWVARYNGPGNRDDTATALAVDAAGNVYVTGASWGSGTVAGYATVKYDTNGNQLWVARYNGPGSGDSATALAVDAAGNVYVTGRSSGSVAANFSDYATVKYDTNGNQLWVARYNLPDSLSGATALALDAAGNVYVTGYSWGEGQAYLSDYATVKYDANGNELWVVRYNGPGNSLGYSNDVAAALAVDPAGNVYVTGYSVGSEMDWDYATIKYSQHSPSNNTSVGSNVYVIVGNPYFPADSIVMWFGTVTSEGNTTVTPSGTGTPPPQGFKLGNPPVYYNIETTASYTGPIRICMMYSGIAYSNEAKLKLFHRTSTGWQDVTDPGYPDTAYKTICGTVNSLSVFAMFEPSYGFAGFLPPLENPPVVNTAGAGRTIPVKWQLVDGSGSYINDLAAVTGCGISGSIAPLELGKTR
jgi:hypothetical protein